jgi:hypothetical protein
MEAVFLALLVFLLLLIIGLGVYRVIDDERTRKKANCVVYIMRVDNSGKVELKRSPEQLWTWKF